MDKIKILFLAADPSDSARLRLGQELRDIREKLQLSKQRDGFSLESRESVRTGDITQAIFDVEPQIVHFSGHGTDAGELCFEDVLGETHPVHPDALANLFELVAEQVRCVVLNACFSKRQAEAISEYIPCVIGMSQAIGDKAAIAFSVGFYRALGAGKSFGEAYKFARVEIQLHGSPGHLTPLLFQKNKSSLLDPNSDNEFNRTSQLLGNGKSQLKVELKILNEIEEALINDKDTRTADEILRQWKKRVTSIIGRSDLYDIQPDQNQKTPYNQTRNVIKKCRIFVEDLLSRS
jgi:hypothetical protein